MSPLARVAAQTAAVLGVLVLPASASEVKVFRAQSQEALLQGKFEGISVDPLGVLSLADQAVRSAAVEEPFVFAAAAHPRGTVVATGNSGKVMLVEHPGAAVSVLFAVPEPEVYALWVDQDGSVLAGSSPNGKVYRLAPGATEAAVLFDPGENYIWALGRAGAGDLLVATGTQGKLFSVGGDGRGRVLYDSEEPHLRSLLAVAGGGAVLGTAGKGLVLEVDGAGAARTLYDAAQPEVAAIVAGRDGARYVAAVASEASLVDLTRPAEKAAEGTSAEEGKATVATSAEAVAAGSRTTGFTGARSEVVRLDRDGTSQTLWRFEQETVYALFAAAEVLWVATGQEGKVFSWRANQMVLEQDLEERQVVAVLAAAAGNGPLLVTTNGSAVYRLRSDAARRGTYTSVALDAGKPARFGRLSHAGEAPGGTRIAWQVRTGMSAEPDSTWSAWSPEQSGAEVALEGAVPPGRYAQWRAILAAGDARSPASGSPRVRAVELSYLQLNQRPEVTKLTVLEAGQILVPANFSPSNQVYEPANPNRDGIFTTLAPATEDTDPSRMKPLWKLGYRTVQWEAKDGNEDSLRYSLAVRPDGERQRPDANGEQWLEIARDLERTYHAFDATVLPDGRYRFRVEASDEKANPQGVGQRAERISESVVVDHRAPELGPVERRGDLLSVTLSDALSALREVVWSRGARPWQPAAAGDGLVDSPSETVAVPAPGGGAEGGRFLLLRVTDAAYNVTTFDLSSYLP